MTHSKILNIITFICFFVLLIASSYAKEPPTNIDLVNSGNSHNLNSTRSVVGSPKTYRWGQVFPFVYRWGQVFPFVCQILNRGGQGKKSLIGQKCFICQWCQGEFCESK